MAGFEETFGETRGGQSTLKWVWLLFLMSLIIACIGEPDLWDVVVRSADNNLTGGSLTGCKDHLIWELLRSEGGY